MIFLTGSTKNRTFRNIIVFLFVPVLLFLNTVFLPLYNVQADVGSLVVKGGSLGSGGLGESFGSLGLLGPVGVIVTSALFSSGIDINITEESAAAGMNKIDYCIDQILNWKGNSNKAVSYLCNNILNGAAIGADGIIYLTDVACNAIAQFGNFVVSGDNFIDTTPPSTAGTATIGNITTLYTNEVTVSNTSGKSTKFVLSKPCAVITVKFTIEFISDSPFSVNVYRYNSGSWGLYDTLTSYNHNGFQMAYTSSYNNPAGAYHSTADNIYAVVNSLTGQQIVVNGAEPDLSKDAFTGTESGWTDFVGGLSLPQDYMGAIDMGIISDIQAELDQNKDYIITLEDYIHSLEDAINKDLISDIPIENVDDGSIVLTPDIPVVSDPAYEPVAPVDIPAPEERTDIVNPDELASADEIINLNKLQLKDVFPFCIPFDLYDILMKFKTSPETPIYHIQFTLPVINVPVDLTIDLTPFNTVAAILRAMELVGAVVGLAIATRRIYIRS